MLIMIRFFNDKRFGLLDTHNIRLEGNTVEPLITDTAG
jgi:hypothetical protein